MSESVNHEWEVRFSQSRQRPYFYSVQLKKSCWDPPSELTAEQIKELPGSELLNNPHPAQVKVGTAGNNNQDKAHKVRASHLLVKHAKSRRPSSWKEANITRTKEEAISIIQKFQEELENITDQMEKNQKFHELASKHSDCSSHSNGGDLGFFGKDQMQPPFEIATFSLAVGELSQIVETESGVHLILRTA